MLKLKKKKKEKEEITDGAVIGNKCFCKCSGSSKTSSNRVKKRKLPRIIFF